MSLILDGTNGLSDVDGTAAAPAIRGTDANTGIFFGTDIIGFSEGGVESARFNASGVFTTTNDATIQGLTVGRGAGAVATNTAFGASALQANTTGQRSVALGYQAGYSQTTADGNSFVGHSAGYGVTGDANTAMGRNALLASGAGANNSAFGFSSLVSNTSGSNNVAVGQNALQANTTAGSNTAVGYQAGYTNVTGAGNTFIGHQAGYASAVSGNAYNTCIGVSAGNNLTTGVSNTFIGTSATASSSGALITTGSKNTILGAYSGNQGGLDIRTASNNIVLSDGDGNPRLYFDNNAVCRIENAAGGTGALRVRNTNNVSGDLGIISNLGSNTQNTSSYFFIGSTPGVSDKIYIYGNGNIQNSNNSYGGISDVKLKENIVDASPKLADLMQVRVRNYNLKSDPTHKQLGVVAQELETIFPALVDESPDRDEEGNTLETTTKSVKYSVFVPMLIKAIQEQQALITALTTRITALEAA